MLFTCPDLDAAELEVLDRIQQLREELRFAIVQEPRRWTGSLRRVLFAKNIQSSNSIEGYNVTLEDAVAAVEGEDPVTARRENWQAVTGYRNAMTYVLQLANDPDFIYSEAIIKSLHYMMIAYDLNKSPGTFRPGFIYIRESKTGEIVYEGPDREKIRPLMGELVEALNEDDGKPAMIRAAMAHLNLVLIHPFKDGNGRMARGLQTLVLGREGILEPTFSSIEEYLGANTTEYYSVLAEVGRGYWQPENDVRPWIRYSLKAHYIQARTLLRRLKESEKLWDLLSRLVEERKLPERTIFVMFDAARGMRVRRATYQPQAEVSENTATRDLKQLVDQNILIPAGERRGRSYIASDTLKDIRRQSLEVRFQVEDPFKSLAEETA
jgi:Fic family protein